MTQVSGQISNKAEATGRRVAQGRMERRVAAVCDAAGDFIAYWGFKAVHGRVWTLLALRGAPMAQSEVARFLGISRSLVSGTVAELAERGLVQPVGDERNAPYEAVIDVWPVISEVLRGREWMLVEQARVALDAALEEAELMQSTGEPVAWDVSRLRVLASMTDMAQSFLKMIIRLRVPQAIDGMGGWVSKAAGLLTRLRR